MDPEPKEDYMAAFRFAEVPPRRYEIDQRPATLREKLLYFWHEWQWVPDLKITSYREVSPESPEYGRAPFEVNHSWFTPVDAYLHAPFNWSEKVFNISY